MSSIEAYEEPLAFKVAPALDLGAAPTDYRSILDSLPAAVYTTDAAGTLTYFNRAAAEFAGREPLVGIDKWSISWKIYQPDGTPLPDDECPMAVSLREQRPVRGVEIIAERPNGERMPTLPFPTPIYDGAGRFAGAINFMVDISKIKAAEDRVARQAAEQAALYRFTDRLYRAESDDDIYRAALDAILEALGCDRASVLLFDDAGVMRFVAARGLSDGYKAAVDGHSPWRPGDRDPAPIFVEDIVASGESEALKRTVKSEGITALAFIPLVSGGRVVGKFMTYHDRPHRFSAAEQDLAVTIARQLGFALERRRTETVRRQAELQRDLMVAELSHRVKNTLATVVSIARQSFSKTATVESARHSFEGRLRALAQTHTRLAEVNWLGVPLRMLLEDELAPYRTDDGSNVMLSGPATSLSAKQAVVLGMAFHELATNAAKYGAFLGKGGAVNVSWETAPDGRSFAVEWVESGGPKVTVPAHSGFGRLLLERALAADLRGAVTMDFQPEGLRCRITLPLDVWLDGTD